MHALWGNTLRPTLQPEAPAAPAMNSAGGAAGRVLNAGPPQPEATAAPDRNSSGGVAGWVLNVDGVNLGASAGAGAEAGRAADGEAETRGGTAARAAARGGAGGSARCALGLRAAGGVILADGASRPPSPSALPRPPSCWMRVATLDRSRLAASAPAATAGPECRRGAGGVAPGAGGMGASSAAPLGRSTAGAGAGREARRLTRTQVLDRRCWDAAAQVRRAQAERARRMGAEQQRKPEGFTVWEAMRGASALERDEGRRERRCHLRLLEVEDAELARALHFSQFDWACAPPLGADAEGTLPRSLTPLERHTAMADSGSRATSASEPTPPSLSPSHPSCQAEAAEHAGDTTVAAANLEARSLPTSGARPVADALLPSLTARLACYPPSASAVARLPSPPWSLTHAAWNALMHALWGNPPAT